MKDKHSVNAILKVPERTTTITQAVFNMSKAAVGVGTLFLPYTMRQLGWMNGLLVLLGASILMSMSLHLLGRLAANTDNGDYIGIGQLAFGTFGKISAMASLEVLLLGALIAYVNTAGRYLAAFTSFVNPEGAAQQVWYTNSLVMTVVAAMLIFPIACMRDMSKLSKTSLVGMLCMGYVCILTIFDYFYDSTVIATTVKGRLEGFEDFFGAFSTIIFSFLNHFTYLSTVPVLVDPTPKRRFMVIYISGCVVFLLYALISIFGYWHFGDAIKSNILLSSTNPKMAWPYAIAQLLIAFVIILSFPLLCDPARAGIEQALSAIIGSPRGGTSVVRSISITAFLVSLSTLIAITCFEYADKILGAFVALSGSLLGFIFPALYFLLLGDKYTIHPIERASAYLLIPVGLAVLIFGTYFNVRVVLRAFF